MDETKLIAAARLGDEDAFAELYRPAYWLRKAVGRSILRKERFGRYVPGHVLAGVYTAAIALKEVQFRTWITRIAMNQCLCTLRKARQASNGESNLMQIDAQKLRHVSSNASSRAKIRTSKECRHGWTWTDCCGS